MSINTNIGPERVEVFPVPIGTVLPQGASTARTALLIATAFASAPLNTPVSITSMAQFEANFGTQADMGEAYLSARGFFENGGEGCELLVVAVSPSGVSGSKLEEAQNADARTIAGSFGSILDDGIMIDTITMTTYDASTGIATLDLSGASESDLAKARKGDVLVDSASRKYTIAQILPGDKVVIEANLDAQLTKASNSVAANGSTGMYIVRQYAANSYDGMTTVQEGATYGSLVAVTVSGVLVTMAGFSAYLNDVKSGDLIVDSFNNDWIITDVIDGDNLQVDRAGLANGNVTFKRGLKNKILQTTDDATSAGVAIGVAPISAEAGSAVFVRASSSAYAPEGASAGEWLVFSDGQKAKIATNTIKASETNLTPSLAGTISYVASTGVVTFPALTTIITNGVTAGDVLIDSTGKEYVIHAALTELTARIDKNIASPSPLAGAKVNKGAAEYTFTTNADFSAKIIGGSDEDTSGEVAPKGNSLVFISTANMQSDAYFIMEPKTESVDFIGSSADFSGLRALDSVDVVNLIAIPGIYDPSVQGALVDYCAVTRKDCYGLLSIPEFITSAAQDNIVVANLAISSAQANVNGTVVTLVGTPDLAEVSTYDILQIGAAKFTIKSVSDQDNQIVVFATSGVPTVGAVSVQAPSAVTWKDTIVNKPSTRVAWYYNHLVVTDSNGTNVTVDPVGHVAGVMARIDANIAEGGVSHAPAGIQLAQLAGTVGLQLQISEKLDGGPLRLAFINRITSSRGNGRYIFGGYSAGGPTVTPDEQLIQVMRSILFIKTSLEPGLVGFLWENNSPVNRANIENAVLAFLRANAYLFPAGLPENQQFRVISQTPSETDLAQGLVKIVVQCRFNTAIRFISIDLEFPLPSAQA
jgi:hypothetical protein